MDYQALLERRRQLGGSYGFEPLWMPDWLFDFQEHLVDWSLRKGRAAIFADCGMGKTPMQLVWAENIHRQTGQPVLIATPLAVAHQTEREAQKFGIDAAVCRDGKHDSPIVITNYERLHYFDAADFGGMAADESSILKSYSGKIRTAIIKFMRPLKHRLLCSATPAPNDCTELGNSAEALGIMRRVEMLATYFVHDGGDTGKWRLKGHANDPFWSFMASWARAVRRPSDLGFEDSRFVLPELKTECHVLKSKQANGRLFVDHASTLAEQREERRATIGERCEQVAALADNSEPFVAWCSLNDESRDLAAKIPDAVEVTGSMTDEDKEARLMDFATGNARVLVTKPSIASFGMNWQHCNATSFFPSHSYEQWYQCIRRFWRYGQEREVHAHIVTTEAEDAVLQNMLRKERMSNEMFEQVTLHMRKHYERHDNNYNPESKMEVPAWLCIA